MTRTLMNATLYVHCLSFLDIGRKTVFMIQRFEWENPRQYMIVDAWNVFNHGVLKRTIFDVIKRIPLTWKKFCRLQIMMESYARARARALV